ncbi:hypothetical protein KAJ89_00825 [Candidatus Parcubacteria bacterium]|nr:hypothetical protein [Candidatus Parcubacteria bacterium]
MNEKMFEKQDIIPTPEKVEKEMQEMGAEEVEQIGGEMDEYLQGLLERAREIKEELKVRADDEHAQELRDELEYIEEQLVEDQEGLEGFVKDIKSGDYSDAKIEK